MLSAERLAAKAIEGANAGVMCDAADGGDRLDANAGDGSRRTGLCGANGEPAGCRVQRAEEAAEKRDRLTLFMVIALVRSQRSAREAPERWQTRQKRQAAAGGWLGRGGLPVTLRLPGAASERPSQSQVHSAWPRSALTCHIALLLANNGRLRLQARLQAGHHPPG